MPHLQFGSSWSSLHAATSAGSLRRSMQASCYPSGVHLFYICNLHVKISFNFDNQTAIGARPRTVGVSFAVCIDGEVRLVGGSSSLEGRVEVCRNGSWGTVCDDSWDTNDATVVCRQLGYDLTGTAYSNAYFGAGTGRILMDDVACTGSESYLTNCSHTTNHNCRHSEDAGVICGLRAFLGIMIGGAIGGIVFLLFVFAMIVICVAVLHSKLSLSGTRARQAAPAVQMTSLPAQTTSTTTGAYTQSQPKAENQPLPPSYSDYMEQQTQPTAPMAYPGYAAPAVGFAVQGYPQQDYSQTGYPQQQQQEAPVGYPQQEPQGYGGTNPGTDESTGIRDEPPPPY
ncbi:PREDICTED: scavenger receptor cysteine-rich type 1 protein M160-like [Amphimedon queenslandica]|uniref:SRCR domain-containing protein n=1 Tax=Amphimedon queenslandica TaxID=400682 RepID=A0AAN0IZR0_AMPQE|nr:PREDICTED: scavenger receptor cysteine-rich type 1 protein M160-like [Amphimedon queenslandica]|eukprot:XP_019850027.1 PREDICTED: scavenger receptor cysteine-rich type 1 protein M160-like [Amphimedon queenslandica]